MTFTYKNYIAKPDGDRFTLYKKVKRKTSEGDMIDHEEIIGHGYHTEGLITKIIRLEMADNNEVKELREISREIAKTLKLIWDNSITR